MTGPVMLRSKFYYVKLFCIWTSFGVFVYVYHSSTWQSTDFGHKSKFIKQEAKLEAKVEMTPGFSPQLPTSTMQTRSTFAQAESVTLQSSPISHALSWLSSVGGQGNIGKDSEDQAIVNDNFWNVNDGDVIEEEKATYINDDSANFNTQRLAHQISQAKIQQSPNAQFPIAGSLTNAEVRPGTQFQGNYGNVLKEDVFTRDISELTQRELIYRFVKNKEEFLGKSEKSLPMYLKPRNLHWTLMYAGSYPSSVYSPPPNELPEQRLPKAIIIGAGKCGTRALLEFLSMHPLAVTPDPEIHYFDVDENFAKGLDWYRSQLPISYSNQMTIEKTPSYIWSARAVEEIYRLDPAIKLMVVIRDPVQRIVSQASRGNNDDIERFFLAVENGRSRIKSESRTVDWGIYSKYLKVWMGKYPPSQIHILEATELVRNPALEIQKIERFLGLPTMITESNFYYNTTKGFYCMRPFYPPTVICLPEAKGKQHLKLKPMHEKLLYDYYRPYNEQLFSLIGRRFTWLPKTR